MDMLLKKFPLDLTGRSPDNYVIGEPHTLDNNGRGDLRVFVPNYGAFYTENLVVRDATGTTLIENVDYIATYLYEDPTRRSGLEVMGAIVVKDPTVTNTVYVDYQVVGGDYAISANALEQVLQTLDDADQPVTWGGITGKPSTYPASGHLHALWELYGFEYLVIQLERLQQAVLAGDQAMFENVRDYARRLNEDSKAYTDALDSRFVDHKNDEANPHKVTKAQVGLGVVDNYPTASVAEGVAGSSSVRFMTPIATKEAITSQALSVINTHKADTSNPHEVTKAQVGLGSVANYPPASASEAITGNVNNRYMTPSTTKEAIEIMANGPLDGHMTDYSNPHNVTKAQVGLGNVVNAGFATDSQAQSGTVTDLYMSPALTKKAIDVQAGAELEAHKIDETNPHNVTKSQVNLGNVFNYGVASQGESESGSVNNQYMTPLRTKQAIDTQIRPAVNAHTTDRSNPHNVTKAQVGLGNVANYPIATESEATSGSSNNRYMTPARTVQLIGATIGADGSAHFSNTNNPHNVTKAQVGLSRVANYSVASTADALAGTANNHYMTPLRTKEAILDIANGPLTFHISDKTNPHNVTKSQVGLGNVANYRIATEAEAKAGTSNNHYMTPARTVQLIGETAGADGSAHFSNTNNPHNVTKAQVGLGNVANYSMATDAEARSGSSNTRYMSPAATKEAISNQVGTNLGNHISNTNNPHNVTKAQVGLGNVSNYRTATNAQARALSSSSLFLTPNNLSAVLNDHSSSGDHDSRYVRKNATTNTSLRVNDGRLQAYVNGGWRTIWPAQWV